MRAREEATRHWGDQPENWREQSQQFMQAGTAPVPTNQSGKARDRWRTQAGTQKMLEVIVRGSVIKKNRPRADKDARTGDERIETVVITTVHLPRREI